MLRSTHRIIILASCVVLLSIVFSISKMEGRAHASGPPSASARPWWSDVPPGGIRTRTVQLYKRPMFQEPIHLIDLQATRPQNTLMSLANTRANDSASSVAWNLPPGVIVILFGQSDPKRPGKQYVIWGQGADPDLGGRAFRDTASGWAWVHVGW